MQSLDPHIPVLLKQVLAGLNVMPGGRYIDCTVGAGGHAADVLEACAPDGRLLGIDADPSALDITRERLAQFAGRLTLIHGNFVDLEALAAAQRFVPADGVLFDLGVSSMELDTPKRGFSFLSDGPLDMRFDPTQSRSAADLVNTLPERDLADLIYQYGEESASRAIARAIVAARPLYTTGELSGVVASAVRRRTKVHPATRTFQALRIAVNDELAALRQGLAAAVRVLVPGGRLVVISFHSLEDRIVKRFFVREARDCICPPESLVCTCGHQATVQILTRKPIRPTREEIEQNPRSRSSRLRIAARL